MSVNVTVLWERLKLIWQTMSYAAALTLLGASRVSTNDQWTAILAQWAWMILIVVVGRIGWVVCLQIVEETRRVLQAQKAKEIENGYEVKR
ncbi:MAG TPA: hypothetical protein VLK33_22955 [Terriglobales bacterium]|nr:hypothetical protein [Terriglobales bacterium]